ncbi:uncharacterized protein LOC135805652 [Sycon ciliatum]|uniref:uncharacterized protein LOC135805652 n=1 Tax=Sycon ciliatum TaxID=27933 RepID=UPI0020A9E7CC|eukprot:scpid86171/ scgid8561/ 
MEDIQETACECEVAATEDTRQESESSGSVSSDSADQQLSSVDGADDPAMLAPLQFVWPCRHGFQQDTGKKAIENYLELLDMDAQIWKWNTAFTGEKNGVYQYRAWFGQPTRAYPLPYPTVDVHFELSAKTDPVSVKFAIEDYNVVHKPQETRLHVHWLNLALDSKCKMIQARMDFLKQVHSAAT